MQGKKYVAALFAAGLAAMTASNYNGYEYSNIAYITDESFETLNDSGEISPAASIKTVSFVSLNDDLLIYSLEDGLALYSNGTEITSADFTDDSGAVITAQSKGGSVRFFDENDEPVTEFTVMGNRLIVDLNGNIHTNSGILSAPKDEKYVIDADEFDSELYVNLVNEESSVISDLETYVSTGDIDATKYRDVTDITNLLNEKYLEITSAVSKAESIEDETLRTNIISYSKELEALVAYLLENKPVYDEDEPYELNTTKLSALASVTVNGIEKMEVQPPDDPESPEGQGSSGEQNDPGQQGSEDGQGKASESTNAVTSTGSSPKTTTEGKTTKKTTSKQTTTASKQQTARPVVTTAVTKAPVQTTTAAAATKAAVKTTTTAKATTSYTVSPASMTLYAKNSANFYEKPSLSSRVSGSCTKYYKAACTGVTNNGFYQLAVDGFTVYALQSDFSDDPQTTVVTKATTKIVEGDVASYTKEMLVLVNKLRKEKGIAPLAGYSVLDKAADVRAKEIKVLFDHNRPDGTKYDTVYQEFNLKPSYYGENITYGMNKTSTVEDAFNNWKNSEPHLKNMLSANYKYMAIGYYGYTDASGNKYYYWEMLFFTP